MKKKAFTPKILAIALSLIIVLGLLPMTAFAITYETYDVSYRTQSENNQSWIRYGIADSSAGSFSISDEGFRVYFKINLNDGWYLEKWDTWFNGGYDKAWASDPSYNESNPVFDERFTFYNVGQSRPLTDDTYIYVSNVYWLYGDFRITAVVRPILTVNAGDGIDYHISTENPLTTNLSGNQEAIVYGNDATVSYSVDEKYIVTSVRANYGTSYSDNGTVVTVSSIVKPATINIQSRLKQQNVSFDANGGEGSMATQTFEHSVAQALTANSFTKDGYTFTGWNTKADGTGTAYTNKQSITLTPANDKDSITLYAQWTECSHAMVYSASKNRIVETCTAGCKHTATATLTASNQTYTGSPITTGASITYSEGWAGAKPQPADSDYSNNINAGTATVITTVEGEALTTTFTINRANIKDATVILNPTSSTYDGSEQKPAVTATWNGITLVENIDYVVYYADNVNASGATVLGTVYVDGINNFTDRIEIPFEITNASLTEVEVKQQGTLTYNGQEKTPTVIAKAESVNDQMVTFTYRTSPDDPYGTMPSFTDAGTYTVYFKASAPNHSDVTGSFTVTVDKADQAAPTGVGKIDETISKKGDGKITGVTTAMEYRKEGENTYTAITGSAVENLAAGKYYVRVKGDSNHNPSPDTEITIAAGRKLTVTVPQNQIGYTLTVDTTQIDYMGGPTISLAIADGYSKTQNFAVKLNGRDMQWGDFTQIGTQSCTEDVVITVEGIADITVPNAEINVKNNKWTSFWNGITFGQFFNETQDVTITATDNGSGVNKVQYHLAGGELSEAEVEQITEWEDYNGTFKIDPNNCYVVYAKVTDNAGNILYINSNGIVLDNIAPTLEGIENGKTYYGDLTVIKSDEQFYDIKAVTLDGEPMGFAEGTYGLIPADNAEHIVVVEDHAGNKTTYTVIVYKNYTVTFKADGNTVDTQTVGYDKDATVPAVPAKDGYTGKWDHNGENITSDVVINAVYTENAASVPGDPQSPQTGDNSNLWLWFALLFVSSGAVITLTVVDRKRRTSVK